MAVLPRPVALDRLALELAEIDVVEQRLNGERNVPACDSPLRAEPCAREAGVDADVERELRKLAAQRPRLLLTPLGERHVECRVAVDPALEVEDRLRVACQ